MPLGSAGRADDRGARPFLEAHRSLTVPDAGFGPLAIVFDRHADSVLGELNDARALAALAQAISGPLAEAFAMRKMKTHREPGLATPHGAVPKHSAGSVARQACAFGAYFSLSAVPPIGAGLFAFTYALYDGSAA